MYIALAIVVVVLGVAAGIIIAALRQPQDFVVERSVTTTAPPSAVYAVMHDMARWREWSPYDSRDPALHYEVSEPSTGEGASYAWNGNKNVGEGKMTIARLEPDHAVHLDLQFTRPFKCENQVSWIVENTGDQRRIVWRMTGRNDGLMPRVMCLVFDMDKMCGKDFEAGLASLRDIAERESAAA